MKRYFKGLVFCTAVLLLLGSCSSNPKVSRVDAETQTDLSGYWNDTDIRIVCDGLVKSCLEEERVARETEKVGHVPIVLVGAFANNSDEHIDTEIISSIMEVALFKSGKFDFVAGGNAREQLRAERQNQQGSASEESAAALAKELGADFVLTGTVRAVIDKAGGTSTRTYFVSAAMNNVETTGRLWMDQNSEIKKLIKNAKAKL